MGAGGNNMTIMSEITANLARQYKNHIIYYRKWNPCLERLGGEGEIVNDLKGLEQNWESTEQSS